MGVWIETNVILLTLDTFPSHPAWVCGLKHPKYELIGTHCGVTPCVGVWIETGVHGIKVPQDLSHPAWVCGLKRLIA